MKDPKISIIIPSYNQGEYLATCIESALDQALKPHEIIVVDDGSTDLSLAIAEQYTAKGVKVISQVNKGLPSARNTGIMNSTGDYILPLDADDILLDDCIEVVTEKIIETGADVVGISFKTFGVENVEVILIDKPSLDSMKEGNKLAYCSAIKKQALLDVGGYSPRMIWGYEDFHLWFNLLVRGYSFETIQQPLFLYRTKRESMLTVAQQHHQELMEQINKDFHIYDED